MDGIFQDDGTFLECMEAYENMEPFSNVRMPRNQGGLSRLPTVPSKPVLYPDKQKLRISWSIPTESPTINNTWVEVQPVGKSEWQHVGTMPTWFSSSMLITVPSECSAVQARVRMQSRNGWGSYSSASQPLILIPPVVRLVLHSLSGKQIELEVAASSDVVQVKQRVAVMWHVPPMCQQLAIGTDILHNADTWAMVHMQQVARDLQRYLGPDVPRHTLHVPVLDVTLVTDHREMCALLSNVIVQGRRIQGARGQALVQTYLAEWAKKDLKQPLSLCTMLLRDRDHHVRHTAILALGQIAPPGDESTTNALLDCGREHWSVRAALLQVLPTISGKGSQQVVAILVEGLFDASRRVRHEACESLTKYTSKGDSFAMAALEDALQSTPTAPDKNVVELVCKHLLPAEAYQDLLDLGWGRFVPTLRRLGLLKPGEVARIRGARKIQNQKFHDPAREDLDRDNTNI